MEPSEDELARRRRKLEAEKLAFEEEELQLKRQKLQMEKGASASILRLNVGGRTFDTTKETLLGARSHFFNRMLEEGDDSMLTGATRWCKVLVRLLDPILDAVRGTDPWVRLIARIC